MVYYGPVLASSRQNIGSPNDDGQRAVWGEGVSSPDEAFHFVHDLLRARIAESGARRILDLGCGVGASLEHVLRGTEFYDGGGRPNPFLDTVIHPLNLTPDERQALVAFLQSLSGTIVEGVVQYKEEHLDRDVLVHRNGRCEAAISHDHSQEQQAAKDLDS